MDTKELLELYKSLFETWRFEVNSHWQRSSYFAAFETVAVAACWKLVSDPYFAGEGVALAALGILLTAVWYRNNNKTHFYAVYWLEKVAEIERALVQRTGEAIDFAAQILRRPRTGHIRHRHLVQAVPVIFFIAWVILLSAGIHKLWIVHPVGGLAKMPSGTHFVTYEVVTNVQWVLVAVGIVTAGVIAWQAFETRRAANGMRESIGIEELKLKQWVTLQNWSCNRSVLHNDARELAIQFELVNRTGFPITFMRAVTRVGQIESHSFGKHSMSPNEPYEIALAVTLTPEQDDNYLNSGIVLSVRGEIIFSDVRESLQHQYFGGLLNCSKRGIKFTPHSAFEEYAKNERQPATGQS